MKFSEHDRTADLAREVIEQVKAILADLPQNANVGRVEVDNGIYYTQKSAKIQLGESGSLLLCLTLPAQGEK